METIDSRIQTIEESNSPLFPDLIPDPGCAVYHGKVQFFGVLEGGTKEGNASLSIAAKFENGDVVILETTAWLFHQMNEILTGAELRFALLKHERSQNQTNQQ